MFSEMTVSSVLAQGDWISTQDEKYEKMETYLNENVNWTEARGHMIQNSFNNVKDIPWRNDVTKKKTYAAWKRYYKTEEDSGSRKNKHEDF